MMSRSNSILPEHDIKLTRALILRHQGQSRGDYDAAITDIAQDLLLRHLHERGVMGFLAFKGGTALRKLYAGKDGRFSVDLDFAIQEINEDAGSVQDLLMDECAGLHVGPFTFTVNKRRGRPDISFTSELGDSAFPVKVDVGAPPWLPTKDRGWVPMAVHSRYDGPLPQLRSVQIEENMAEKIVRLNRATKARDMYDLVWVRTTYERQVGVEFDHAMVRRLAVLKNWVDAFELESSQSQWTRAHGTVLPFEPDQWLRDRKPSEINMEDLGRLADSTVDAAELAKRMRNSYGFLADLTDDEKVVARRDARDRELVLGMLASLPGGRMARGVIW